MKNRQLTRLLLVMLQVDLCSISHPRCIPNTQPCNVHNKAVSTSDSGLSGDRCRSFLDVQKHVIWLQTRLLLWRFLRGHAALINFVLSTSLMNMPSEDQTTPVGICLPPLPEPTEAVRIVDPPDPGAEAPKGGWKLLAVTARGVTATMLDDRTDTISVVRRLPPPDPARRAHNLLQCQSTWNLNLRPSTHRKRTFKFSADVAMTIPHRIGFTVSRCCCQ